MHHPRDAARPPCRRQAADGEAAIPEAVRRHHQPLMPDNQNDRAMLFNQALDLVPPIQRYARGAIDQSHPARQKSGGEGQDGGVVYYPSAKGQGMPGFVDFFRSGLTDRHGASIFGAESAGENPKAR